MIRGLTAGLFFRLPFGLALLALAGALFVAILPETAATPEELPDCDYLPAARKLAASGDYEGCIQLCADIVEQDLPHADLAIRLLADCERKRGSLWRQSRLALGGFISGDASTPEAAAGAVLSDLTLYGDVRDIGVQGYRWVSGGEPDPFIAAFSAVGLATELADWIDWMPAVLKAFKRAGVFTQRFSGLLLRSARGLFGAPAARRFCAAPGVRPIGRPRQGFSFQESGIQRERGRHP